jgi:hypothetical protein
MLAWCTDTRLWRKGSARRRRDCHLPSFEYPPTPVVGHLRNTRPALPAEAWPLM